MIVKHKINMDFLKPDQIPVVDAVQNDQYSRQLELTLFAGGEPFVFPEGTRVVICFSNAEGKGGNYDSLPNGSQAWQITDNVLTLELPPQVFTVPGPGMLSVELWNGSYKLSTFAIMLNIHNSLAESVDGEAGFPLLTGFLPAPESSKAGQYIQVESVDEQGGVLRMCAVDLPDVQDTVESILDEMVASGELKGESAYELAVKNGFEGSEAEWIDSLNRPANGSWGRVVAQRLNVTSQLTTDGGITVNFGGNRLKGVNDPEDAKDAANKRYVDSLVADPYAVPDYWQEAVDRVIAAVKEKQNYAGMKAFSFAWFSDCHMIPGDATQNTGKTGLLAAAVMDACNIPFAIFTGDAVSENGDTFTEEAQLHENHQIVEENFKPIGKSRLIQTAGEHDIFWGADLGNTLSNFGIYNTLFRKQALDYRRVFGEAGSYYYLDDPISKVRIIVLNCYMSESGAGTIAFGNLQLNWLVEKALDFSEAGWSVIFAAHAPCDVAIDYAVLRGISNAINRGTRYSGSYGTEGTPDYVSVSCDYSEKNKASVAGYFCGHSHIDKITHGKLACSMVSILPDAMLPSEDGTQTRTAGTADEHVLDFVTVDVENKMIYLTRLGAGEDRMIYY